MRPEDWIIVIAVPVLGAWSLSIERRVLDGWRRIAARSRIEADKFVLRVQTTRDGYTNVGTSVEIKQGNDQDFPSSKPTLESEEVQLLDDADRKLVLPKGLTLEIRDFDGARRVELEAVTSSLGTKHRLSFEVKPETRFWIRDAPSWHDCEKSEQDPDVRVIPRRKEGYRLSTSGPGRPIDPELIAERLRWPPFALALIALGWFVPLTFRFKEGILWVAGVLVLLRLVWRWLDIPTVPDDAPPLASLPEKADRSISVTIADLTLPLWAHGFQGPERWLFGPKRDGEAHVAILTMTDPDGGAGRNARDPFVGSAAFVMADHLWTHSDACVTVGVPIVVGSVRMYATERAKKFEDLHKWVRNFTQRLHIVWGQAKAELSEGYALHVRPSQDALTSERELEGPLLDLREKLMRTLEREGALRSHAPPRGFEPLAGEAAEAYQRFADLFGLPVLMSPKNAALPRLDDGWQRGVVDLASDLMELATDSAIPRLLWLSSCIYARDGGGLNDHWRERALAHAREAQGDDVVHRLSPAIFYRLGERSEAIRACERALTEVPEGSSDTAATYRDWVREVRKACEG